jgi:hypothetical protein
MKQKLWMTLFLSSIAIALFAQIGTINVPDTGAEIVGTNTHGTSHSQWNHEKYLDLNWGGSATGDRESAGFSSLIDCVSHNKLVIKAEGSASNTTITIRVWFFDYHATQVGVPTESFALVNTGVQEGTSAEGLNASYYHFVGATMDVLPGAEQFKIEIVSVANGTGKVWGRAV